MVKIKDLYTDGCKRLSTVSGDSASFEVLELIKAAFGINQSEYFLHSEDNAEEKSANKFNEMLSRREKREPLQYILGEWEFYGLPFKVGKDVLIPRSDTEIIAETAVNFINKNKFKTLADLCSGSGALAIALGKNTDLEKIDAVELSEKAFSYLWENIKLNNMENKIKPYNADIFSFKSENIYDIVVSNPPYIPTKDIEGLSTEVKQEPIMALDGGKDGLYFYRKISEEYFHRINEGGMLIFEIGINQLDDVADIMYSHGYKNIDHVKDYAGIPRCIYGIKKHTFLF